MFLEKGNQQQIEGIVYTLPISVTCTFGHGVKKQLILTKVQGDSFYFEKYYHQKASYNCFIKSVGKIKFHRKSENILYVLHTSLIATSVFFTAVTFGLFMESSPFFLFTAPYAALNFVVVSAIGKKLPKSYIIQNWKLHVL